MEDSHFSDREYQMVLETEAEGLVVRHSERILERASLGTKLKVNPSFQAAQVPYFHGTKTFSPADPLTICGVTISGCPSCSFVQESGSPFSKEITFMFKLMFDILQIFLLYAWISHRKK